MSKNYSIDVKTEIILIINFPIWNDKTAARGKIQKNSFYFVYDKSMR